MAERPAVNASPLISLARSGLLDKLAGADIVVPRKVADEILRRGPDDPTARALREMPWLIIVDIAGIPPAIQACRLEALRLGA